MRILHKLRAAIESMSGQKWQRLCVAFIVTIIFFGYIAPWIIHQSKTSKLTTDCMTLKMEELLKTLDKSEATLLYPGSEAANQHKLLPLIGNGYIGLLINHLAPHSLRLKYEMSKTVIAPYRPMVRTGIKKYNEKTLYVINYKKGTVERIQCYFVMNSCVWLNVTTFAHRSYPSLFYELVSVDNTSPISITLETYRNGPHYWKGSGTSTETFRINGKEMQYTLSSGKFPAPYVGDKAGQHHIALVVAATVVRKEVEIPPESSHLIHTQTVVKYSEPILDAHSDTNILSSLVDEVEEELYSLLHRDMNPLVQEHLELWSQNMWNSFITVEPNVMINEEIDENIHHLLDTELTMATMYSLLSSALAPFVLPSTNKKRKKELLHHLQHPQSCFNGPPTFLDSDLFKEITKESEMNDLLSQWGHTLYKHGCAGLLSTGTAGYSQAVMLSFLGGQFSDKDISFHANPANFRARYYLHNLLYNTSFLDIYVDPRLNRQTIHLKVTSSHSHSKKPIRLFACGAGCMGKPIELTGDYQVLDLKWTEPESPFLYLSHDEQHLANLWKIIHIKKAKRLDELPSKPEINKSEGFHIPVFFWICVISMIILFHMFLIKLIFNEYCGDKPHRGITAKSRLYSKDASQA